jgi:hypothetical protein
MGRLVVDCQIGTRIARVERHPGRTSPYRRSPMPENTVAGADVAGIAASSPARPRGAEQMLAVLRRPVPFDGA